MATATETVKLDPERPYGTVTNGGPVVEGSPSFYQDCRYFDGEGRHLPGMDLPSPPPPAKTMVPVDPKDVEIYELKKRMAELESKITGAPVEKVASPYKVVDAEFNPETFDYPAWATTGKPSVNWLKLASAIARRYGKGRKPVNRSQAVDMIFGRLEALPGAD